MLLELKMCNYGLINKYIFILSIFTVLPSNPGKELFSWTFIIPSLLIN